MLESQKELKGERIQEQLLDRCLMFLTIYMIIRQYNMLCIDIQWLICLHLILLPASSSVTSTLCMSFITSMNLLWSFPLFLLPGSPVFNITSPINSSNPHVQTLSAFPLFVSKPINFSCPLTKSFLILCILVSPNENSSAQPAVFLSAPPSHSRFIIL